MSETGRKRFVTVLILCLVTFFLGTLYASTTRSRAEGEDTAKESDAPAAADESIVTIGALPEEEDALDLSDYDAAEEYLGDYASMLETLRGCLSISMSGFGFCSHDISFRPFT